MANACGDVLGVVAAPAPGLVADEALEPIVEEVEQSYSVDVPYQEGGVTKYRKETRTRTVQRTYRTAVSQINYLKRKLGLLETQKVDPLIKKVGGIP